MNKTKIFLLLTIVLLFGCTKANNISTSIRPNQPIEEDVYKIAVVAPQFGPYKALGNSIINGARLAVNLKNKSGGIDGKQIKLIEVDDGGLPGEGTWRARDLVNQMVLGVIGHLNSDISIPASEVYVKAMIPEISPASTSPAFTEREVTTGYVFRTIGRDDDEGKICADLVKKKGMKKIAVLYNNRPYGFSVASEFVKQFSPKDMTEIVFYEKYNVSQDNFLKEINILQTKMPELIFFVGEYSDAAKFFKQLRKVNSEMYFLGSEGVFDQEFISLNDEEVNRAYVISSLPVKDESFITQYKNEFNSEIGSYSATSFDATNILISAIIKVQVKDPEKIAQEIQKTTNFPGITGKISFNSNGDIEGPGFTVYEIKDGKFEILK